MNGKRPIWLICASIEVPQSYPPASYLKHKLNSLNHAFPFKNAPFFCSSLKPHPRGLRVVFFSTFVLFDDSRLTQRVPEKKKKKKMFAFVLTFSLMVSCTVVQGLRDVKEEWRIVDARNGVTILHPCQSLSLPPLPSFPLPSDGGVFCNGVGTLFRSGWIQ